MVEQEDVAAGITEPLLQPEDAVPAVTRAEDGILKRAASIACFPFRWD